MNGSNTVRFAQEELAYYFGRMLPQGGAPDIALAVEEAPGPDRFSVRVDAGRGTISGNCPRAVLLGVYDYLRRRGCRFLGPGRVGEYVPAVSPQDLAANYSKTASFAHRGVCIEGADSLENVLDFVDWLPKVGFNSFFLQFKTPYPFLERYYHHVENPLRAPEPYGMEDALRDMERIEAAAAERGLLLHKAGHGWTGEPLDLSAYERNNITLPTDLGENLAFLRRWKECFSGDSFVFDYPLDRAHHGDLGYVGISRIISSDIKRLRSMGLGGYISCQELRAALPNALPNYVMGYTLFDESVSVDSLIDEYFAAAYGEKARGVKTYLSELSRLSRPDYVNGRGPRVDPEVAAQMAEAVSLCEVARPAGEGLWWKLLKYHRQYALHLAAALYRLSRGEDQMAALRWLALRELICRSEPEFQPWLDVYRVMEVTKKYTGFPDPDRSPRPAGAART